LPSLLPSYHACSSFPLETLTTASCYIRDPCEGYHMRTINVVYEWIPSRCSSCKIFGHVLDECPKQPVSDVLKNLKNPRQAGRGVPVSLKVENDDDLGTDERNSKVVEIWANSGMVSYAHNSSPVASSSPNIASLVERINNLERQIMDEKLILVNNVAKPLNKVDYAPVNSNSKSDVEVAYDETT
nr:zinc knuckle CX2CX4HX4C [Tanacetum cinerariifolium]